MTFSGFSFFQHKAYGPPMAPANGLSIPSVVGNAPEKEKPPWVFPGRCYTEPRFPCTTYWQHFGKLSLA